jgi:hypothetical protein
MQQHWNLSAVLCVTRFHDNRANKTLTGLQVSETGPA